jgi:hypothetical protein
MFFTCWFKGVRVPLYFFWSLFSFYHECWRTGDCWLQDTTIAELQASTFSPSWHVFQPQNCHPRQFFKFVEMSVFLTICYSLKLLPILIVLKSKKQYSFLETCVIIILYYHWIKKKTSIQKLAFKTSLNASTCKYWIIWLCEKRAKYTFRSDTLKES